MKWHELQSKSETELQKLLAEKRKELVDLRFRAGTGVLKQVHQIRVARRLVARIVTLLASREKEQKTETNS